MHAFDYVEVAAAHKRRIFPMDPKASRALVLAERASVRGWVTLSARLVERAVSFMAPADRAERAARASAASAPELARQRRPARSAPSAPTTAPEAAPRWPQAGRTARHLTDGPHPSQVRPAWRPLAAPEAAPSLTATLAAALTAGGPEAALAAALAPLPGRPAPLARDVVRPILAALTWGPADGTARAAAAPAAWEKCEDIFARGPMLSFRYKSVGGPSDKTGERIVVLKLSGTRATLASNIFMADGVEAQSRKGTHELGLPVVERRLS